MFQMMFKPTNSGGNLLARLLGISILGTEAGQFGVVRVAGIYETEIVETGRVLPARPEHLVVLHVQGRHQELGSLSHQASLSDTKLGNYFSESRLD